jgi:hypothetical protein
VRRGIELSTSVTQVQFTVMSITPFFNMARGILAHRIPRDTTNPIPTQFILTGLKIPITSQVDPHMTAEGMVINISAINPTNLRYTTQALHLLPIHLLQMLRGITKERHLLPGLTLLATISNRVQSINKISFNTQLRCPLCLRTSHIRT